MTCNHCVDSVRKSLKKIKGIKDIDIDLATGRLLYSGSEGIRKNVEKSILSLGYKIKNQ